MTTATTSYRSPAKPLPFEGRGYLVILMGALLAAALALQSGLHPAAGMGLVAVGIALLIWMLERRFPHRPDWRPDQKLFSLDLLHTLVSSQGVAPLVRAGLVAAAAALSPLVGGGGLGLWPTEWPLVFQLLLAVPVADFGIYWAHRFMHSTDIGWRIHAVHHSPTRLYFMASARSHPLNALLTTTCQFGSLVLLGASAEVLTLWSVFMAVNGLLQHANIDFQPRLVSRVLATCDVHRAHHSLHETGCNYGNSTMIWDQVFGTFVKPPRQAEDVGAAGYDIPESYLSHLAVPFRLSEFEEQSGA